MMIFITQTNTGTMVNHVSQEQMFVIEATLLENQFLPSSGFVMLMSVEDILISLFLQIISSKAKMFSGKEQAQ